MYVFRPHDWQGEITPSPISSDWSVCPSISRELGVHRYTTVYVYHTTLGRFSKVDCTTTKREDINTEQCVYTSLEISRRDFPTPTLLPPALFEPWRYQPWKIGPRGRDIHRRLRPHPFRFSCLMDTQRRVSTKSSISQLTIFKFITLLWRECSTRHQVPLCDV